MVDELTITTDDPTQAKITDCVEREGRQRTRELCEIDFERLNCAFRAGCFAQRCRDSQRRKGWPETEHVEAGVDWRIEQSVLRQAENTCVQK